MADPSEAERSRGASEEAVERFAALSGEVRGCAILGSGGVLAATGEAERWADAARGLLDAADLAAGERATHAHVATEEGEVYVARLGDLEMVAVTSRFTLASLVFADMRAALRRAAAIAPVARAA